MNDFPRRESTRHDRVLHGDTDPYIEDYEAIEGQTENQSYRQALRDRKLCRDCEAPLEPHRLNNSRCELCAAIRHKRDRRRRGRDTTDLNKRIRTMLAGLPDPRQEQ